MATASVAAAALSRHVSQQSGAATTAPDALASDSPPSSASSARSVVWLSAENKYTRRDGGRGLARDYPWVISGGSTADDADGTVTSTTLFAEPYRETWIRLHGAARLLRDEDEQRRRATAATSAGASAESRGRVGDGDEGDEGDDGELTLVLSVDGVRADAASQSGGDSGDGGDGGDGADEADSGLTVSHTFTELGWHDLTLTLLGASRRAARPGDAATAVVVAAAALQCKYVRREVRTLDAEDRDRFFGALAATYASSSSSVASSGGGGGVGKWVALHAALAGDRACDHLHDGLGFLTQVTTIREPGRRPNKTTTRRSRSITTVFAAASFAPSSSSSSSSPGSSSPPWRRRASSGCSYHRH